MRLPPEQDVLHEVYAATQLFRQLGFSSDDIYLTEAIDGAGSDFRGKRCIAVQLNWRDKVFVYTIAPVKNRKRFTKRWIALAEEANANPESPKWKRIFEQSHTRQISVRIVTALHEKGITPPLNLN